MSFSSNADSLIPDGSKFKDLALTADTTSALEAGDSGAAAARTAASLSEASGARDSIRGGGKSSAAAAIAEEIAAAEGSVSELQGSMGLAEATKQSTAAAKGEAQQELSAAEQGKSDAAGEKTAINQEITGHRNAAQNLRGEASTFDAQGDSLISQGQSSDPPNQGLINKGRKLKAQAAAKRAEADLEEVKAAEAEAKLSGVDQKVTDSEQKIQEIQQKIQQITEQLSKADADISKIEGQIDEAQAQIEALKTQLSEAQSSSQAPKGAEGAKGAAGVQGATGAKSVGPTTTVAAADETEETGESEFDSVEAQAEMREKNEQLLAQLKDSGGVDVTKLGKALEGKSLVEQGEILDQAVEQLEMVQELTSELEGAFAALAQDPTDAKALEDVNAMNAQLAQVGGAEQANAGGATPEDWDAAAALGQEAVLPKTLLSVDDGVTPARDAEEGVKGAPGDKGKKGKENLAAKDDAGFGPGGTPEPGAPGNPANPGFGPGGNPAGNPNALAQGQQNQGGGQGAGFASAGQQVIANIVGLFQRKVGANVFIEIGIINAILDLSQTAVQLFEAAVAAEVNASTRIAQLAKTGLARANALMGGAKESLTQKRDYAKTVYVKSMSENNQLSNTA